MLRPIALTLSFLLLSSFALADEPTDGGVAPA
ncbi:MAG: hypothetical protein JWM53_401, partial [bacterium]|nr:hypothetical protein [bacterium]